MASHGSDTPTSPRAVLHHKDTILCTFMHTTVQGKWRLKSKRKKIYVEYVIAWKIIYKRNMVAKEEND